MSSAVTPEEAAIHNDELDRLHRALKKLNPKERELVHALFADCLTEREYAKQIFLSQKTVCKRWQRVRELRIKEAPYSE